MDRSCVMKCFFEVPLYVYIQSRWVVFGYVLSVLFEHLNVVDLRIIYTTFIPNTAVEPSRRRYTVQQCSMAFSINIMGEYSHKRTRKRNHYGNGKPYCARLLEWVS